MNQSKQRITLLISVAFFTLLILDPKTAAGGVIEGMSLCIQVIIPSLLPFFLVTTYLNSQLSGIRIPGLNSLGRFLHIPSGGESLLLLGLIGGYPVGAKMIGDAFTEGKIDKNTGQILLGYCNNAGPAFIFGISGALFQKRYIPFILWIIHILSAVITGFLLPRPKPDVIMLDHPQPVTISKTLHKSISVCVSICGWIIVFRIIMAYIGKYLSPYWSKYLLIIITGILELSNGCILLSELDCVCIRFIICSAFIAFGGLCVALQTLSVSGSLKFGMYFPGKLMQTCISMMLTIPVTFILFPKDTLSLQITFPLLTVFIVIIVILKRYTENKCGNLNQSRV